MSEAEAMSERELNKAINLLRNTARQWGIHSGRRDREEAGVAQKQTFAADKALRELVRRSHVEAAELRDTVSYLVRRNEELTSGFTEVEEENDELRERVGELEGALAWAGVRIKVSSHGNSERERERNWKEYEKYEATFLSVFPANAQAKQENQEEE